MNPSVKQYITNARNHELELRGFLHEKQYIDDETMNEVNEKGTEFLHTKYPGIQYDDKTRRYYHPIPIEISDEDYAELMKYPVTKPISISGSPAIAVILSVLGWSIIICSLVLALWIAQQRLGIVALYVVGGGCISSLVFFAFSKIIGLLDSINSKL